MKHPDIRMTADGKMDPYIHGEPWDAGASIELVYDPMLMPETAENAQDDELENTDYALLSEEDVEKVVAEEEEERSKNQNSCLSYRDLAEGRCDSKDGGRR